MHPILRILVVLAALCACSREAGSPPAAAPEDSRASPPALASEPEPLPSVLDQVIEPHTGDLPEMLQRRQIRALVAVDRTHFFFDRGAQKGITADALVEFDRWINAELKTKKNLKMQVVVVPVRRDQLLPALLSGKLQREFATIDHSPATFQMRGTSEMPMNRCVTLITTVAACLALFACLTQKQAPPAGLVIADVTIVSPERSALLEHAYVRILDGRIVEVSASLTS